MNKSTIPLKCNKCKRIVSRKYGTEHGIQYARIQVDEMTYPWSTKTTIKHYYNICKKCLDKLIKELDKEEKNEPESDN